MNNISDEMLMAYADGQIDDAGRRRVERYLASDPAGHARLQAFIETGPALARLLDNATSRPLPGSLVERILKARIEKPAARRGRAWRLPAWLDPGVIAPVAFAASATLVLGGLIGWALHEAGTPRVGRLFVTAADGGLRAGPAFSAVLETAESGQSRMLDGIPGGSLVTPVMSLRTRHPGVCRQYRLVLDATAASGYEGLACRTADGGWRIDVHTPVAVQPSRPGRYAPASGRGSPIVDGAIDKIIDGDSITSDEEVSLIGKRWAGAEKPSTSTDTSK